MVSFYMFLLFHFSYGGRIFLTSSLDFEAEQNLTLFVTASDGEKSDFAPIQIVITDVNDNKPTFDQAIYDVIRLYLSWIEFDFM